MNIKTQLANLRLYLPQVSIPGGTSDVFVNTLG